MNSPIVLVEFKLLVAIDWTGSTLPASPLAAPQGIGSRPISENHREGGMIRDTLEAPLERKLELSGKKQPD
jgi:hypothetical protein